MSSSTNPPAFEIPMLIPPLPSSSYHGKENDRSKSRNQNSKESHDASLTKDSPGVLKATNRSGLGLRTPQTGRSESRKAETRLLATVSSGRKHQGLQSSPSPGSLNSAKKSKGRSVLRFGETTEFLFCLTAASNYEHRRLARGIVDGSMADDPKVWRQALTFASELKTSNGTDLIRLHRRATLRFPIDRMQPDQKDDIIAIWLAFASVHAKLGMIDEARRTCRYMENQKVNLGASFFLEISRIESDYDHRRAEDFLLRGIKENAQPEALLQEALDKLRDSSNSLPAVPSLASSKTRTNTSLSSPKRQKTEGGFVPREQSGKEVSLKPEPEQVEKTFTPAPPEFKLGSQPDTKPKITFDNVKHPNGSEEGTHLESQKNSTLRARPIRSSGPRLGRKGLVGKAKRVEPETSVYEESESEPENTCDGQTSTDVPASTACTQAKPSKIKKMDLSYMWEWDPSARGKTQDTKPPSQPAMDKIEEASASASSGQTSTASSQATNRSGETTTTTSSSTQKGKTTHPPSGEPKENERRSSAENAVSSKNAPDSSSSTNTENKLSSQQGMLDQVNMDFLPLVHENNILRVNRSSYAKLGVIGKGGSCKVYRALSKKCSVVAIKKVKLEGMEKKAIEGYANEISLLKKLQGNPAIIQMYDSEVDVARKSIYVVMEVGEADLNHILQQRALSGGCRALNMNFIRLTWQQMLSAVHCIHEERIIHSDLKPANFLFVRGALKLIDFGIAKAIQSDDTTNIYRESHIGTLNYMSPEAILDTETGTNGPRMRIGRASDVWSLGCILYEMVHGKTPFANLHFIQKLQAIVNPNHPIEISEDVDEGAIDAIKLCLLRDPEDRPPIVGRGGLLNEHRFLHSASGRQSKKASLS